MAAAGIRYAPEDPTLPKPWKGLVDGNTGYLYFWNPETNVTQYDRPASSHAPAPHKPLSSSVHVQKSYPSPRDEHDRYNGSGNGNSVKASQGDVYLKDGRGGSDRSYDTPKVASGASVPNGNAAPSGGNTMTPEAYRRRHEITVSGANVPPPLMSFDSSVIPSEILREVQSAGFSAPTPIQAQSWPIAIQGRDIVAIAKTGSGKTLGYLLPGFIHLRKVQNNSRMGPTVLVLSPTRELATQIQDEALKFCKSSRISCTCLYGGAPKGPQLKELDRGTDIVVATPGRLNDILEMRRISLHQISFLVLDEADRMLDMGFEPQIRKIVKEMPTKRQTLMYTATWPKEVRKIASDLLVNPVQVNIGNVDELVANKSITQHVELVSSFDKQRRVEQIVKSQEPGSKIIIFCSTKKMCDQLSRNLTRQFGAAAIHGDKNQSERDHVLNQFRSGKCPVLVATDVAARGLDVKDIRVVINYDFPTGVEDYVHRIGRTGRAGATGVAYTFFGDQDSRHASDLTKILEGANQHVPPEIRDMASRGGGGMGRSRWGSGGGGYGGGRGGRNDSDYGGRGGGRGYGRDSSDSDRYGGNSNGGSFHQQSFHSSVSQKRSPDRSSGWGGVMRARSRSPERFDQAPSRSFHETMLQRAPKPKFDSIDPMAFNGNADRKPSSRWDDGAKHEDEEEGMIRS